MTGPVAVVYNPIKRDVERVRAAVLAQTAELGLGEPLWFETTLEVDGAQQARAALAAGASLVIASGGDGTVRSVAGALRGTGVPLGIVPSGTGNLLARTLGVPMGDPERAVELALVGAERPIDVGLAGLPGDDGVMVEHPFLVIAGLGIDAAMIENTSDALKARLGWLAYIDGGLRSLVSAKPAAVRYQFEGHSEHTRRAQSVLVGNVGSLPGNIELMPQARIDDGLLDVAVLHPKTVFGWLFIWRTVMWENRTLRRSRWGKAVVTFRSKYYPNVLSYSRGSVLTVRGERPMPVELDGDGFGTVSWARFTLDPLSLVVKTGENAIH